MTKPGWDAKVHNLWESEENEGDDVVVPDSEMSVCPTFSAQGSKSTAAAPSQVGGPQLRQRVR